MRDGVARSLALGPSAFRLVRSNPHPVSCNHLIALFVCAGGTRSTILVRPGKVNIDFIRIIKVKSSSDAISDSESGSC